MIPEIQNGDAKKHWLCDIFLTEYPANVRYLLRNDFKVDFSYTLCIVILPYVHFRSLGNLMLDAGTAYMSYADKWYKLISFISSFNGLVVMIFSYNIYHYLS